MIGDHIRRFRGLSRRRFLRLAGATGAVVVLTPRELLNAAEQLARWSDPQTWGGSVPGPEDVAVVSKDVLLDVGARVAGVVIERGASLTFDPGRNLTLRTSGNVVVMGRLTMRPASPRKRHRLVFLDVDETQFVGEGMEVLETDVGVWVMGRGILDIAGTPKRAWTRTIAGIPAGATKIELRNDPVGWRVGDLLVLTPTISPSAPQHFMAYDYARVKSILGRTIFLNQPTRFKHPKVRVKDDVELTPEILNLTRNVGIEGTPHGRAHVFIHSSRPQRIYDAALRHLGPRQPDPEGFTQLVIGRYALHFHDCADGSKGSVVSRVVVEECGSHSFVPHESNGVTFHDCISHNTMEDAYWWDHLAQTKGTIYDGCVASLVQFDPPFRGFRLTGFFLGATDGNVARNCVAVGIQGDVGASGFAWPEDNDGVWEFEDCVAHNNAVHGIFTWQNTPKLHVISNFVGYHNGGFGILHGAYTNGYRYEKSILYANKSGPLSVAAVSIATPILTFVDLHCDAAGFAEHAVVGGSEVLQVPPQAATRFIRCTLKGHTKAAFGFACETCLPYLAEIRDCTFEGNEFWLASGIDPASYIEVRDAAHGNISLQRADLPGEYRPKWNASVNPIA